jgi:hypothetical protein
MANQDAAFGLRPVKRIGGTPYTGGQSRYRIAANYGTAIFQGDLVMQVTGGGVEIHADGGTVPIVGVFNGRVYCHGNFWCRIKCIRWSNHCWFTSKGYRYFSRSRKFRCFIRCNQCLCCDSKPHLWTKGCRISIREFRLWLYQERN